MLSCRPLYLLLLIGLGGRAALADEPGKPDALLAQIAELKAEVETLKAENAELKEKLAAKEKTTTTKPVGGDVPQTRFELGGSASLGHYTYATPVGWTPAPPKENKLSALYRSPDKVAIVMVQVQPKGAASPEMQPKYAQAVVKKLKLDYVNSKTEVVDPPTIQNDPRFYLKVHERVRVKGERIADQTHIYRMASKDVIELTVITTAEATDQVAFTQKMAEDLLLSFKPEK